MNDLRNRILQLGADLVGFADLSAVPTEARFGLPNGIAFGIALNTGIVSRISSEATLEYFDEYSGVSKKLDAIGKSVSEYLTEKGFAAIPQTGKFVREQRDGIWSNRALLPHKTVAALAGFGWIGKNSLLITPQYGSAVRISSVITDAPVNGVKSTYSCRCGTCRNCADACPGKAIKNIEWNAGMDRDELIDFSARRRTVAERGLKINKDHGACGVCISVCPHTRKYVEEIKNAEQI